MGRGGPEKVDSGLLLVVVVREIISSVEIMSWREILFSTIVGSDGRPIDVDNCEVSDEE